MDIYTAVTDRIIEELECGFIPWQKPWTGVRTGAIKHTTGKPYSLLNQMLLNKPGEYLTFNQCKIEGGKIKKGSKAKFVVFWKPLGYDKRDADGNIIQNEDGEPIQEMTFILRYYQVFHIDECEGIKARFDNYEPNHIDPIEQAESALTGYIQRSGVRFENMKQNNAYYSPTKDLISLPLMEQFLSAESYYETAFHEATHSTGHKNRLNRFNDSDKAAAFGSESYSKEELVAEIGACGIMHELGIETKKTFTNNAAYIQNWLRQLKNDKRLIVSAASRAEKAIKLILDIE